MAVTIKYFSKPEILTWHLFTNLNNCMIANLVGFRMLAVVSLKITEAMMSD